MLSLKRHLEQPASCSRTPRPLGCDTCRALRQTWKCEERLSGRRSCCGLCFRLCKSGRCGWRSWTCPCSAGSRQPLQGQAGQDSPGARSDLQHHHQLWINSAHPIHSMDDTSPTLSQLPGTYQWLWCWRHCCSGRLQTDTSTRHCRSDRLFWWRRWSPRWSPRWRPGWSRVWRCPRVIFSWPSSRWWRRPGSRSSARKSHIWRTVTCRGSAGDRLRQESDTHHGGNQSHGWMSAK